MERPTKSVPADGDDVTGINRFNAAESAVTQAHPRVYDDGCLQPELPELDQSLDSLLRQETFLAVAYYVALTIRKLPFPAHPRRPATISISLAACEAGCPADTMETFAKILAEYGDIGARLRPLNGRIAGDVRRLLIWAAAERALRSAESD